MRTLLFLAVVLMFALFPTSSLHTQKEMSLQSISNHNHMVAVEPRVNILMSEQARTIASKEVLNSKTDSKYCITVGSSTERTQIVGF